MNISTAACNSFYQGYHLVLYNSTTLWVLSDPRWSSIFDWRLGRGKSKLLVILSRIRWCSVTSEQNTILIILISLILFLIKLVESLTSTRKVPRVLCTKMRKLGWMDIELVWMPIGRHVVRNDVHRCHLVFLLPFHPTVLEPYFDLSFGQAESVSYFDPSSSCQISVEMEFLLQLKSLITRVRCSLSFSFSIGVYCTLPDMHSFHPGIDLRWSSTLFATTSATLWTSSFGTTIIVTCVGFITFRASQW